ncbi:hypothetical protein [Haloplanus rubicundus]|jgi:hypothetical protein|uniref:Uncharacterized protein n=1 Tax=Haloplanus rubicundus TaxID=1547898 RepID=A0A345EEA0_9EURY|nr:hypothetical protein [Haloplanus rubicundus]AXG10522.1 hypothetical protein DU484_12090 [Haloplanus rubicundus]
MTNWSPPSIPRNWFVAIVVFYVLLIAYSVLIVGQLLLGVLSGFVFVFLYFLWRCLVAVEAIADAQQRMAFQQEENG